jgi:hypothetical protein
MPGVQPPGEPPHGVDPDQETLQDALDVLGDLVDWQLAEEKWHRVEELVAAMAAALENGDMEQLRDATTDLEIFSPGRITRIGAAVKVLAPPPVRARADDLLHFLTVSVQERDGSQPRAASAPREGSAVDERRTTD